ncbi:HAD family acid phosphatase [Kitasatospora sp. CM 4170]|uniref:HAD family acid phosphatase n=1 Tax=Kitasatospora aburaviensis TaxID=67265 RepID=A0ABW1F0M6_9ACTN|nr:HAD family acid phosphatase [Kitasatospora sp. CM 4170]WNM49625.1 HAD family acid phosphatase [Kitasatospora sp. CM 4170]
MSTKAKLVVAATLTAAITAGLATPAVAAAPTATAASSGGTVTEQQWLADVAGAIAPARAYVEQRTAEPTDETPAIVFDIDNTTLATHFHPLTMPGISPVVELARYAHARGVAVIFVTARVDFIAPVTRYSLEKAGYTVDELHGRDLCDLFKSVQQYKTDERAEIENEGYTIIASIGNNWTDLGGGHAERTFKLPDYNGLLS